jgi:hypothetical protein
MSKKQRKPPTLKERMTPCVVCLHPLSQRHHLLSFSVHGEKGMGTVQLCANCHDLYHLFERYARKQQKDRALYLLEVPTEEEKLIEKLGSHPNCSPLIRLAAYSVQLTTLFRQEGDFDFYSQEDKNKVHAYMHFMANFKIYVESERQKMNKWFEENGLFATLFGEK